MSSTERATSSAAATDRPILKMSKRRWEVDVTEVGILYPRAPGEAVPPDTPCGVRRVGSCIEIVAIDGVELDEEALLGKVLNAELSEATLSARRPVVAIDPGELYLRVRPSDGMEYPNLTPQEVFGETVQPENLLDADADGYGDPWVSRKALEKALESSPVVHLTEVDGFPHDPRTPDKGPPRKTNEEFIDLLGRPSGATGGRSKTRNRGWSEPSIIGAAVDAVLRAPLDLCGADREELEYRGLYVTVSGTRSGPYRSEPYAYLLIPPEMIAYVKEGLPADVYGFLVRYGHPFDSVYPEQERRSASVSAAGDISDRKGRK